MIEQILEFIQNHWILSSAAALLFIMLIIEEAKGKLGAISKISAKDLAVLLNRENTVAIDLRNKDSFANSHILGSINIAYDDFEKHLKKLGTNKNKTLILIDNNGSKTSLIGAKLKAEGFTKIHTLAGGIASWKDAQLPLNKK